jgi:ribonuclease HII
MIQLDLTKEERQALLETLDSTLSDLRMEIANTDRMDFREMLKARKAVLERVIEAVQAAD